ncbi:metal-dependent hydrolase [Photobacterium sp.]|uniref:metal-dependent hydrolase n=1 Tax=Photobacterium sp. TaxID=660 RepID=UPI00299EAA19|nr:metal-dependent hydrolase [Photobacterium sp.]MDX1300779.1 metal-dependent hydrolase [Photobacterium sp.]
MANFSTHLNCAAIASGLAATALLSAGNIQPITALWLAFLGSIGGLLPDIDSDNSTSMKTLFGLLAAICSFVLVCHISPHVTMLELILYAVSLYLFIRYSAKSVFEKITVHRGCCHSLAFVALLGICIVCLARLMGYRETTSWLSGLFVTAGGVLHLVLDEVYSVDLANRKIKSSFGTALKIISLRNPMISFAQVAAILALYLAAPPYDSTLSLLADWQQFQFRPSWLDLKTVSYSLRDFISSTADIFQGFSNTA